MEYNSQKIIQHAATVKLVTTLVLSLFFCEVTFAQNEPDTLGTGRNMTAEEFQKIESDLLEYVEKGVAAKLITPELRDSILQYVRQTKMLMDGGFFKFAAAANARIPDSLPPNRVIVLRDGIPILVDTTYREQKLTKKQLELALEKSPIESLDYATSRYRKNGVDDATLYPDKLPVPERDKKNKNKYQYLSQEEIKRNIIRVDYFSKGLDGYYQKQIALGQVGQGWEETREMRELVASLRASVMNNVFPEGQLTNPVFLDEMMNSKNSFVKFLGGLLGAFQNGARRQIRHGYTNPNPMIQTPPAPSRR